MKKLVLVLGCLVVVGCKKETVPQPETKPVETAATSASSHAGTVASSTVELKGIVSIAGNVPEPQPLKRGSDPVCAKNAAVDETIVAKNGRLANVVVRVTSANVPPAPKPSTSVVLDQNQCMYRPRVAVAVEGQPLQIKNSDGTFHNVHTYEGDKTWFNVAHMAKAAPVDTNAPKAGTVIKFKCDVHPWMTGYVIVSSHPFHAVTAADGSFTISGLPAGEYTLEAWHEKLGVKKVQARLGEGAPPVEISYSAEDRG
jgi:plastocyanin